MDSEYPNVFSVQLTKALESGEVTRADLAVEFDVAESSVGRWANAAAAPAHPLLMAVAAYIERKRKE